MNACNLFFPSDWAFYAPFVTDQNVLWGDYSYFNHDSVTGNLAEGDTLVHIEACPTCFAPGDHTFYGRYNGAYADDAREPLPTTMATRFLNGGGFTGGTDFLIWREADESDTAYNCNLQGPPTWYPLSFFQVLIFDEQEALKDAEECWWGDPACTPTVRIPNTANRIDAVSDLLSPFDFGWMHLNLQHHEVIPIYSDPHAQMWLTTVMESTGRFGAGFPAIQLDNAGKESL